MLWGKKAALLVAGNIGALVCAAPAFAQTQPDEEQAPAGLEEIVVTAQKREQNLQAVPLAISAIGEVKIERLGIKDSRDLSGLAPNLTIGQPTTNMTAGVISIRGIPSGAQESMSLDQANGLYVDGVYIARSGAAALDVTDLVRVEVLRGPQGTLFGRNTTGGAIAFVSRDPSKDFRASLTGGVGNYGLWSGRVSIDPGEIFGIATTFTYAHRQNGGYADNLLQPDNLKDPGAVRSDSFRAAFMADLGSTGSIRYIFDYSNIRGNPAAFHLLNVSNGTAMPPVSVGGVSVPIVGQAPVSAYLAQAAFLEPGCAALAVATRAYRDRICSNVDLGARDRIWGHNLQITNDFGAVKLKSTTGYRAWHSDTYGSDLDGLGTIRGPQFTSTTLLNGMPAGLLQLAGNNAQTAAFLANAAIPTTTQGLFDTDNIRRHRQLSQELELSGASDTLDWVLGGFYFWEKGSEYNFQNSGFVVDTNSIFLANFGALGPSFVAANPVRYRLNVTKSLLNYVSTAESKAIYGQATYYFGGRDAPFSLTGGLRYTWDSKSITRFQNGTTAPATPENGAASFSRLTWNVMARYAFARDISVYARAASGYRSGGFNPADNPPLVAFRPEKLTSFEVGLKSELFERRLRLNLAGYYNKYKDFAVITTIPSGTTFNTKIVNAGNVDYLGFEIEGQAVLSDNFSIDGSFGYVDVRFHDLLVFPSTLPVNSPAVDVSSISHPTYTSNYTANVALNAQFPLGSGGAKVVGRIGYTYMSPQYSFINVLSAPYNEQIITDPQHLLDAQLVFEKIPLGGVDTQIKLWVKNLTNEHDMVRAIDFGPLGYAGGYYNNPRTFGATVTVNF